MSRTITTTSGKNYLLRKAECDWVDSFSDPHLAMLCIRYALAYNRLEPEWLNEMLAEDAQYSTQMANWIETGRREISGMIETRLRHPNRRRKEELTRVELTTFPDDASPCCRHHLREGGLENVGLGYPLFWMHLASDDAGEIKNLQSGCLPQAELLGGSGLFPGVPFRQLKAELAFRPPLLPREVPLEFHLSLRGGDEDNDKLYSMVNEVAASFPFHYVRKEMILTSGDEFADAAENYDKGIRALPHLRISAMGKTLIRLAGTESVKRVSRELDRRLVTAGSPDAVATPEMLRKIVTNPEGKMTVVTEVIRLMQSNTKLFDELAAYLSSDVPLIAQRAAYVFERFIRLVPCAITLSRYTKDFLAVREESQNSAALRHVISIFSVIGMVVAERVQVEEKLFSCLELGDDAICIEAIQPLLNLSIGTFSLRPRAAKAFERMLLSHNPDVVEDAERALESLEYLETLKPANNI